MDVFLFYDAGSARLGHLVFEWDSPPPLPHQEDRFYYHAVIFPEVLQLVREYLEVRGRVVGVEL